MDLDIYDVLTIDTGGLYFYRWFSTFHEPLIENISSSLIFYTKMPFIIISYYVNFRGKRVHLFVMIQKYLGLSKAMITRKLRNRKKTFRIKFKLNKSKCLVK